MVEVEVEGEWEGDERTGWLGRSGGEEVIIQ